MILRLHRLAVAEIDHEVDYYESKQPGLGAALEGEVEAVLSMIARFPLAAPRWKTHEHRRVARHHDETGGTSEPGEVPHVGEVGDDQRVDAAAVEGATQTAQSAGDVHGNEVGR